MAELSWIHVFLLMILKLQLKATFGQQYSYTTVTTGADVTLPCQVVKNQQDDCGKINWIVKRTLENSLKLVTSGKIDTNKLDRLNLTKTCSLVIKNVTLNDVGLYTCTQEGQRSNGLAYLSVVTMTEQTTGDQVTVNCTVWSFGSECEYTVKWLREGKDVNPGSSSIKRCSTSVSFTNTSTSTSTTNSLTCEVIDPRLKVLHFPFRPRDSKGETAWWWFIVVALVALTVGVVVLVRKHKTTKGKKTQETSADADDGLSYASVGFKKRSAKAQVQSRDEGDEDGGDDVTYSTVKAASSAAAIQKPTNELRV